MNTDTMKKWAADMEETRFRRDVKTATDRFLGWKLPKDFAPDAGVSFAPPTNPEWWPIGTNLLTADQAREMFEYCLAGTGFIVHHTPSDKL